MPKPEQKWRFTVDLRNLNLCTKGMAWSIPSIPALRERIGKTQPKVFAEFDMPIGYNQFPIDEEAKHLTSFTCWMVSISGIG